MSVCNKPFSDFTQVKDYFVLNFPDNCNIWSVFFIRMLNQPWLLHKHPSIAMPWAVHILFVLRVVIVLHSGTQWDRVRLSDWRKIANCSINLKLNASHSMLRGGGWGNSDGRWKQLPISLGFKCAYGGRHWQRVWVPVRHGLTLASPTPQLDWNSVCRPHELQVHVIYPTSWSICRDSLPT